MLRPRPRNQLGTLAEFAPALAIAIVVLFFILGFGFFLCGVSTAYFACQLASREGATGGSRAQIIQAAKTAAAKVATGPFGQFCTLQSNGGGKFSDGLQIKFFQLTPATGATVEFNAGAVNPALLYEVRVESNYQITVPFIGTVQGTAASDNMIDHPEALAI